MKSVIYLIVVEFNNPARHALIPHNHMIKLTKLNGAEIYINPDLINSIECHPNTTILMTTGEKVIVKESPDQIVERITEYKRKILIK